MIKTTIKLAVKHGRISPVSWIPPRIQIMILDYDIDGVDDCVLEKDKDGNQCVITTWGNDGTKEEMES